MNRLNTTQKNDNLIKENTTQKVYTYFEGFAGIGAQACALHRLEERLTNVRFECVGISEFDDKPVKAYEALNGPAKNYGDITKIDWSLIPHIDILTWSSPCQDVSTAGKGKGKNENGYIEGRCVFSYVCRYTFCGFSAGQRDCNDIQSEGAAAGGGGAEEHRRLRYARHSC